MFFGKLPKGVISDPRNYIEDFVGFKAVYFGRKFCNKIFWIGNDPPPFRKFSKKTSIFAPTVTPKLDERIKDQILAKAKSLHTTNIALHQLPIWVKHEDVDNSDLPKS